MTDQFMDDYKRDTVKAMADRIEALEAALKEAGEMWVRKDNRIEVLEAALRFYADYERYDGGRIARAALAPEQDKPVHGYAIVPLIPTPRMVEVGCDNNPTQWNEGTSADFAADVANDVYVAMVRAALAPEQDK